MARELTTRDPDIIEPDRRRVVFCSIDDLESTLSASNEDKFLRSLMAATEDRFFGWQLPEVHREAVGQTEKHKRFPFDLGQVLPWRSELETIRDRQLAEVKGNSPDA
jgi:hypothetical protein